MCSQEPQMDLLFSIGSEVFVERIVQRFCKHLHVCLVGIAALVHASVETCGCAALAGSHRNNVGNRKASEWTQRLWNDGRCTAQALWLWAALLTSTLLGCHDSDVPH